VSNSRLTYVPATLEGEAIAATVPPQAISPQVSPIAVEEVLLALPGFTTNGHSTGLEGFFYAEEITSDQGDFTRLLFPNTTAARVRTALAELRARGYTVTEHTPRGDWGSAARAVDVEDGVVHLLPDDASLADRADRLLWAAGFTRAQNRSITTVPSYTTPTPVSWRPDWLLIDVTAPRTTGRDEREELAAAIAATFSGHGWGVDVRGTESLHVTPATK
jgi:hypothetical protein